MKQLKEEFLEFLLFGLKVLKDYILDKIGYILLKKALGNEFASQERLFTHPPNLKKKLTFYFDFSSPWSYLCSTQIDRVVKETNADIEYVPVLLGALFKEIRPNVPMISEAKKSYHFKDLNDWRLWWGVELKWPTKFPIRTVTPLSVSIVEPRTFHCLYKAAWVLDKNIGDENVLKKVLEESGFDSKNLLIKSQENWVKEKLKENTTRAINQGVCGVPSFQVDGGDVIWGQDRLDILMDLLCGWNFNSSTENSRSKM